MVNWGSKWNGWLNRTPWDGAFYTCMYVYVRAKSFILYSHFRNQLEPHRFEIRIYSEGGFRNWLNSFKVEWEVDSWRWCLYEIGPVLHTRKKDKASHQFFYSTTSFFTMRQNRWTLSVQCTLTQLNCVCDEYTQKKRTHYIRGRN